MRKVTYKKTCLPGLLWLTFILFSTSFVSGQQRTQTGSWGDQGDGTYRTPVLNAEYAVISTRIGLSTIMTDQKH